MPLTADATMIALRKSPLLWVRGISPRKCVFAARRAYLAAFTEDGLAVEACDSIVALGNVLCSQFRDTSQRENVRTHLGCPFTSPVGCPSLGPPAVPVGIATVPSVGLMSLEFVRKSVGEGTSLLGSDMEVEGSRERGKKR